MKHGAGIYKVAKKLNCSPDAIIDFSSNINLYQPEIDLKLSAKEIARYGDSSYSDLKEIIAQKYKIKKSQIALYNGATSAIFELMKKLKANDIYLYAPLYGEYEKAAKEAGKKVHILSRLYDYDAEPKKGAIVVFVNPTTPDGKQYDLERLFPLWKRQKCTIVIDESFIEFENHKSFIHQINNYNKLYFIKSFTKFYACAGVRVGAIFSQKSALKKFTTPLWNLSTFDVTFLSQRLQDKEFQRRAKKLHKKQKTELKNILEKSKLFDYIIPSDTNFILVHSKQGYKIYKHLLKHKILVRTAGSFDFLSNDCLRFAVKDKESHKRLKKALKVLHSIV